MTLFSTTPTDELIEISVESDPYLPLKVRFNQSGGEETIRYILEPSPSKLIEFKLEARTYSPISFTVVLCGDDCRAENCSITSFCQPSKQSMIRSLVPNPERFSTPEEAGVGSFRSELGFIVSKFDDGIWVQIEASPNANIFGSGSFLWAVDEEGGLSGFGAKISETTS